MPINIRKRGGYEGGEEGTVDKLNFRGKGGDTTTIRENEDLGY